MNSLKCLLVSLLMSVLASQAATASPASDQKKVDIIAQSVYQDKLWPAMRKAVPNVGDRKSLMCVFSKTRNLAPYNILLSELYRESFGDGISEKVSDFLNKNSHDFTYQFHMQAMSNGAIRVNALDTRDNNININHIVDFYPDEKYDFIDYGKLSKTATSQQQILSIYQRFFPGALQKKCLQNYQHLER